MNPHSSRPVLRSGAVLSLLLLACALRAQTVIQTNVLRAGWNAVWMTVDPTNRNIASVFAGLPVESVWTYTEKPGSAQFIRNQDELPWGNPGWRRYLTDTNRSVLTTLFSVDPNRAYMVKATNSGTLRVTGRPSVQPIEWAPDGFSLRGFSVDPHDGITVSEFFTDSPAHAGQPVFDLKADGQWQALGQNSSLLPGVAYWVFTQGASQYQGPWSVELEQGDTVDFASVLNVATLTLKSRSPNAVSVKVLDVHGPSPLSQSVIQLDGTSAWRDLPLVELVEVSADRSLPVTLSVRRSDMTATSFATVLSLEGRGLRHQVAVTAQRLPAPATDGGGAGFSPSGGSDSSRNHVGLWVGNATIDAVSEPHSGVLSSNVVGGQASLTRPGALPVSGSPLGVLREVYLNIAGTEVSNLTQATRFPYNPSLITVETNFEAPVNFDNDYGQRMRAMVTAPAAGTYRFGIAGDNNSQLWLATDANPANRVLVASVPDWSSVREFLKYPSQVSAPITLRAGQVCYLEALMKDGFFEDNLSVAWQVPGGGPITNGTPPIPGAALAPYSESRPQIVPTPTVQGSSGAGSAFPLRLMVHVDSSGQASFLKEVIQLWRDGAYLTTTGPNGAEVRVVDTNQPGRHILLTDDSRIGDFKGVGYRNGERIGRRISTVDFDFPETHLPMSGSFAKGCTNRITLVLGTNSPTNPFRHRQHPDHDNYEIVNNQRVPLPANRAEVFTITRDISLELSPSPLIGSANDYGYNVLDGTYRETITGLHQKPLLVRGKFRLTRVAVSGELNPAAPTGTN